MLQILAKPVAAQIEARLKDQVRAFGARTKRVPRLAVVLVGEDPASVIYTSRKGKAALALGMEHETIRFPATATPQEVKAAVDRLNADPRVDGILVQRPLPPSFKNEEVIYWVDPLKDVDAFHPDNVGKLLLGMRGLQSCTPLGVMVLLEHYQIPVAGKLACVIGRSAIVGKPMSALLLNADATVVQCHSRTPNLCEHTLNADILVVAAGRSKMVKAGHVKKGAVVIDVGIHRDPQGKINGDVDYESVAPIASAITPVPGGVGPMTIAMLMNNTLQAAELRERRG